MEQYEKPSMELLDLQNDAILTSGGGCASNLLCPANTSCGIGDEDIGHFCDFGEQPGESGNPCFNDGSGCPTDCFGIDECFDDIVDSCPTDICLEDCPYDAF